MNKNLVMSAVMVALLAACSSKPVKEEPAPPVVDKSPAAQTSTSSSSAAGTDSSASTAPVSQSAVGVNPLTDPNNILSKRNVYFDYDKEEVKPEYWPTIEAHAKYLIANPKTSLIIQGNADDRGSREYNLSLGQRRAAAVKKVFNVYGASDKQIETVSYGEEKPRCSEQTETCWSQNRRADIIYTGE